jgi:hypothetical protein
MAESKIKNYVKHNLRSPPEAVVLRWARQAKIPAEKAKAVLNTVRLRHSLGTCLF